MVLLEGQAIGLKPIISSMISKEVDLGVIIIYFKSSITLKNELSVWIYKSSKQSVW